MDPTELAASYGMTVEQYEEYVKQYYGAQGTSVDSYNPENPSGATQPPASS